jgi:hypothetical protein
MTSEVIKKQFLPVLVTMQKDPVPNIRMNIAKTIMQISPQVKSNKEIIVSAVTLLTRFRMASEEY